MPGKARDGSFPTLKSGAETCLSHEAEGFLRFKPPTQRRRARCHEKHPVAGIHVFVCRDLQRPEALGRIVAGIGRIGKEDVGLPREKNLLHRDGLCSLPRHLAADKRAGLCAEDRQELPSPARREVEKLLSIIPGRIGMRCRRADPKSGSEKKPEPERRFPARQSVNAPCRRPAPREDQHERISDPGRNGEADAVALHCTAGIFFRPYDQPKNISIHGRTHQPPMDAPPCSSGVTASPTSPSSSRAHPSSLKACRGHPLRQPRRPNPSQD